MEQLDMSSISKAAEAAVIEGAQADIAKVGAMLGGAVRVEGHIGETLVVPPVKAKRGKRKGAPVAAKATKAKTPKASRPKGDKRTPAEMAIEVENILKTIVANPGINAEGLAKLGFINGAHRLPIKKLITDGKITAKGLKRATRYFPVPAGS